MSIEKRKLFHFVSKLIFDAKCGNVEWQEHNMKTTSLPFIDDCVYGDMCFTVGTPDDKTLWLFIKRDDTVLQKMRFINEYSTSLTKAMVTGASSKIRNLWLELRNSQYKLEISIDSSEVNSLWDLYRVIREQQEENRSSNNPMNTPAAEQTIDLILNSNKETAQH